MLKSTHIKQVKELWKTMDSQRGHLHLSRLSVGAPLAALFYLRWVEYMDAEQAAIAAFDDVTFEPTFPENLRWQVWQDLQGEDLQHYFTSVLLPSLSGCRDTGYGHTLQRMAPVLADFSDLAAGLSRSLINLTAQFDFSSENDRETAGQLLEEVLRQSVSKTMSAEASTPQPIIDLMVELTNPQPGDRVYDPCFGQGGLLVACARRMRQTARQMPPKVWADMQQNAISGVEINPHAYVVGLTRIVLAGIDSPGLEQGDVLERSATQSSADGNFDCILANPPFNTRISHAEKYHFPIKSTSSDELFLQHIMAALRPGGRAVIAVPEGVLFRTGEALKVRKKLLTDFRFEGVISLPEGAFLPCTGIKTNLLVFQKEKPAESVRFMLIRGKLSEQDKTANYRSELEALSSKARSTAERFRSGKFDADLWETPLKAIKLRDWDLVAKNTGADELDKKIKSILKVDASIEMRTLESLADIFTGISYQKNFTASKSDNEEIIAGLVRVADITQKGVQQPSLFLTEAGKARLTEKRLLQKDDLLLSLSGTIGKVAVVGDDLKNAVAAKSVTVIRCQKKSFDFEVLPEYLLCLFRSAAYGEWLQGHARGATIQHLSIRTLRNLPLPLPSLHVQARVAVAYEELQRLHRKGDGLTILYNILTKSEEHPVLAWLEHSEIVKNILSYTKTKKKERLALLDKFVHSLHEQQNKKEGFLSRELPGDIEYWLERIVDATHMLLGINDIPASPTRYTLLSESSTLIENYLNNNEFALAEGVKTLTYSLLDVIEDEKEDLLAGISVAISLKPDFINTGLDQEVSLLISNQSLMPIRKFKIVTKPQFGEDKISFFDVGREISVPLMIPSHLPGKIDFEVSWKGSRIDGDLIENAVPLSIEVRSIRSTIRQDIGTSPYIVGSPIDREEMFFGRQGIIDQIKRQLTTSHQANVILLEGNRRTGKTSILKRLEAEGVLPEWIVVNCSFQSGEGVPGSTGLPTKEIFLLMAKGIGRKVYKTGIPTWLSGEPPLDPAKKFEPQFFKALRNAFNTDYPLETFELYLQEVIEAVKPRHLLLMLDEFDKLQEGIDAGITSPSTPENIRYLLHTYNFSALLTGSRRIKRLRDEYWSALFGFGHRIGISALPLKEAQLLVTSPVAGRLHFVTAARDLVVQLCACHPFLIQSLCNRIFEQAASGGQRSITMDLVEKAVAKMVADNEHFRTLWGYAGTDRRRFILALAVRLAKTSDPVSFSLLETMLEKKGVYFAKKELSRDIDFLLELELLELDTSPAKAIYRVGVPLMARWIQQHIDFSEQHNRAVKEGEEVII